VVTHCHWYAEHVFEGGLNVGTIIGGIVAFTAGIGMAAATVVGVVHSQQHAATKPISGHSVSYGTNK
jgi:hypothetical protein